MTIRTIIHLQAGDENWTPTKRELRTLRKQFQDAALNPNGGVVATRAGVYVNVLEVDVPDVVATHD